MIYICIPTHNEQQTVGVVLWKLRQVLTEFPRDYQLLVADDASTDKTQDVLEPYTRVLPLTVIRSEKRQGYAASLEMLLREAVRRSEYPKRDVVVTLQADFSEEPDDIVALIKRMEAGADVAVGIKVSAAKESGMRRFARTLSRFFARKQAWPEGVTTPFDGYRAYRLYAVKRAMEDRGERRLVRYDGWACHAELLRAVLPHARRVEALEVEDRTDRMQRPRREKPMAAAWQVRAMASGAEPAGLLSVADLDRTAATASRSRERATVAVNGNGNGSRRGAEAPRGRRPERPERSDRPDRSDRSPRGERGERQERGRGGRTRDGARGESRADRPRGERSRSTRPEAEPKRERQAGGGSGDERRRTRTPRAPKEPAADAPRDIIDELLAGPPVEGAEAEAPAAEGGDAAPKKRRRRRRSGRGSGAAGANNSAADAVEAGSEDTAEGGGEGPESEGGDGEGAKKRRRRGGRRGGRGRRRSGAAEGVTGEAAGDVGSGGDMTEAGSSAGGTGAGDRTDAAVRRSEPALSPPANSGSED